MARILIFLLTSQEEDYRKVPKKPNDDIDGKSRALQYASRPHSVRAGNSQSVPRNGYASQERPPVQQPTEKSEYTKIASTNDLHIMYSAKDGDYGYIQCFVHIEPYIDRHEC